MATNIVEKRLSSWTGLCCHYTPGTLLNLFSSFIISEQSHFFEPRRNSILNIADLFAGDGRLGITIGTALTSQGIEPRITNIEIDKSKKQILLNKSSSSRFISTNVYHWKPDGLFDLVVMNPPYLTITLKTCNALGLDWEMVRKTGPNLYTAAILKAISICKPNGIVAVIAPFSWLEGSSFKGFRESLKGKCSKISLKAFSKRSLFPNVHQDIAFQCFELTEKRMISLPPISFSFHGTRTKPSTVNLCLAPKRYKSTLRARIGSIVWNRSKHVLTNRTTNTVPVIYGVNISHSGDLSFDHPKIVEKQNILRSAVCGNQLIRSPFIALRRTLRGKPNAWMIDSALVTEPFDCVAENHVITIELPNSSRPADIHRKVIRALQVQTRTIGTPNLNMSLVLNAIAQAGL